MSVTIRQAPATIIPGFNDIIYVVSSDHVTDDNFQYVCDVYIYDDNGTVTHAGRSYLREKTPADPIYSSGVFNLTHKVRQFLKYDIGNDIYGAQKCPNSIVRVECKFGEEFGGTSGVTVYPNQTTATSIRCWNGAVDFPEYNLYDKTDFVGSSISTTRRWLTNRPSDVKIKTDEDAWLYAIVESTSELRDIQVHVSYVGGGDTNYVINNPYGASLSSVGRYMIRVPAGTRNLKTATGSPSMFDNAVYYDISGLNSSADQDRQALVFTIDSTCSDYTDYRFHFLNKLGGFDSFTFTQASQQTTDIERQSFKRNMIKRIGGGRYGYNTSDHSDVQHQTKYKESIKVVSGWITEEESTWLEELISSPVVYHDHPTYGLMAVTITDSKYIRKKWRTDGLSNLEMTFKYSYDGYRQDQ